MTQQTITHRFQIRGPQMSFTFTAPLGTTRIGRHSDNDLVFTHPLVSRHHVQLVCTVDSCVLIDLGSMHGTFINETRVEAETRTLLTAGTMVDIGAFHMVYDPIVTTIATPEEEPPTETAVSTPNIPVAEPDEISPAVTSTAEADEQSQVPAREMPSDYAETTSFTPLAAPPSLIPPPPPTSSVPPATNGHYHLPPGLSFTESSYLQYLPDIYADKDSTFIPRFLALLESILAPIEWNIDNFYLYLDAMTAPASFLPWLANWHEIVIDGSWGEAQKRSLLKEAHQIYRLRGTAWALSRILEIYTDTKPEIDDTNKNLPAYTFSVHIPLREREVNRAMIEHIIDVNKPAHTTYTLIFKE